MTEAVPILSGLLIYPIKSLDGVAVDQVTLLPSGAIRGDRAFALFDPSGHFINGKRNPRIHALRSQFDRETGRVSLTVEGSLPRAEFKLPEQKQACEAWLADYFGSSVQLRQNLEMGFPDDTVSPGPTIVSTATLAAIASWFPGLTVAEVRRRFRANIEIGGVPAFWEDRLFTTADQTVDFQIGEVRFLGVNPCQRCVVVTRDAHTGAPYPNFQKTFVAKRQETLPTWAERSRFNHFYRLAINTRLPASEAGKTIQLGDPVKVLAQLR